MNKGHIEAFKRAVNHYQYISNDPTEEVKVTFKYLKEVVKYINELEDKVENQQYKCKQLNNKVDQLLKNQLMKLDTTLNKII